VERERLAKLLGMLASDQNGEVLAAARAVTRLVRDGGLSWDDLLIAPKPHKWTEAIGFPALYTAELRRRMEAERQVERWREVAEAQRRTVDGLRRQMSEQRQGSAEAGRDATGHTQLDRLLAAPLDGEQRIRVEAIASWFRRTGTLTRAEQEDLARFEESLAAAA
jgi:hypothetical protein